MPRNKLDLVRAMRRPRRLDDSTAGTIARVGLGLIGTGVVLGGLYALYTADPPPPVPAPASPAKHAAPAPAPAPAPSYPDIVCMPRTELDDKHIVGAGVCLTNDYRKAGKPRTLTVFLIHEHEYIKTKGGHALSGKTFWCFPMGGRKPLTDALPAQKAAEELNEELHVKIRGDRIGDPTHFCRVDVPVGEPTNPKHMAFYVSRRSGEGNCGQLTREGFQTRRDAAIKQYGQGSAYAESFEMTHVPVENLLKDGPSGTCRDIDGTELVLRDVMKKLLKAPDFRATLQSALDSYNEYIQLQALP